MKKITLLILFFAYNAIIISNLFAQQMTCNNLTDGSGISIGLRLNSYEVASLSYRGETMHEINLSGIFIPNDEGMPNLPRISRFVAVPKDAEVRISVKSMETERLQDINIAPALRIQAIPEEPVMDYIKNDKVYETNEFYPQNIYNVSEVTSLRGINAVMVGITPFQYNPVTKELIVITNIELEFEYIGGSREYDDPKYRSPWFDPILKNALLNYEVLEDIEYTPKTSRDGSGCEYLIVIPNRDDFRPLAEQILEFRTKQGIYTKIMSLEEMGITGTNPTSQIKTWFHNAYNTWDIPPVAVLLMGDHISSTNITQGIPAETISHPYSGTCITDNQYASLSSNLMPNMVFGRMAAETEADMAVLVSKFLEYETQPCMEADYYKNPITALGWQTERWFQICSEAVGGYWRKMGKTPVRINAIYQGTPGSSWSSATNTSQVVSYFGPSGTGYIPATPSELGGWSGGTAQHVINAINSGAFALQHRDHGYEPGWGEPDFTIPNISSLTNVGKMTYLFTINCLTGKFNHSSPCFGEAFHRYTYQGQNAGCMGFLGPTEVSYSFVNDAFAWGMYDLFDPTFLPTYGPQGPHSAAYSGNWMPAFGNVAGKYFLAQSSWPYNTGDKNITYQMFTAHSDIFLRLFTEVPQDNNVSHAEVSLAGNSNFLISASEGSLIALTAEIDGNLEILDVAVATGAMQVMTISSTLLPTTVINVVVTGQNYLRYEAEVMVVPAEGPYIVSTGYTVENEDILTYISENSEISVLLKNVGIETTDALNVTISSNDPQLTITQNSAQCTGITPDETKTANFKVTVANDIPNNKVFSVDVIVTENGKARTWESKLSLKAFAPIFSLKKVLIDGVENGNLPKGNLAKITTVVENKGGAEAFSIVGKLIVNEEFIIIPCEDETKRETKNLPAGESMSLDFLVVTSPNMPSGYEVDFDLLLNAMYGRTYTESFKAASSGSGNYCIPSITYGCSSNDRFTHVKLVRTSDQVALIDHDTPCNSASNGYIDHTNIVVPIESGVQYTLTLNIGSGGTQYMKGWFDLNGNNAFETNEMIVSSGSMAANSVQTFNFTVPQDFTPGSSRFRLRCQYNSSPTDACSSGAYGQTLDYTIVLPELYPRVENVEATLQNNNITVTWEVPAEGTPVGYNIYRNGGKLNEAQLTDLTYIEENIEEGVYVYNVTAVYAGNKESYSEMSNVICFFLACEKPVNFQGAAEGKTATITWEDSDAMEGTLLGYNIYRNETKINEDLVTEKEYYDENLAVGTYCYQASSVYEHCAESDLTEAVCVTIEPQLCEPPVNLDGSQLLLLRGYRIILTWDKPENIDGELLGYNIYRDEDKINEVLVTDTEYYDDVEDIGDYSYQVSAVYEHCESELTDAITINVIEDGVNDFQTSSFDIFPNPATGEVTIQGDGLNRVEIFDLQGRILAEYTHINGILKINDLSKYENGVYFVRMYSDMKDVVVKRLVIMK